MAKFGVVTSYSASLKTVGSHIVDALIHSGHEAMLYTWQIPSFEARRLFNKGIVFIPFDPIYMNAWILLQRDYNKAGIPSVTYTTVEGEPKAHLIDYWVKRDGKFVANSEFTKMMLKKVGVDVIDVIPHGVNIKEIEDVDLSVKKIKNNLGYKVLFGTVANAQERKGLDKLAEIIKIVNTRLEDAGFYVLTSPRAAMYFSNLKNTFLDTRFGKLSRKQVLEIIGNFDFYLCTSHAEGFCLPVLEAQALGVPVIYPEYEPITEFIDSRYNFPFKVISMSFVALEGFGIKFLMHMYDIDEVVEVVEKAYEVYTCNKEKYEKLCEMGRKKAREYDSRKVYTKFIKIL